LSCVRQVIGQVRAAQQGVDQREDLHPAETAGRQIKEPHSKRRMTERTISVEDVTVSHLHLRVSVKLYYRVADCTVVSARTV